MGKNVLVAYFSASGRTGRVAAALANAADADLFEIRPQTPYTAADLDWTNKKSRSSLEMSDPSSRPEIKSRVENMGDYGVVFLGFPVWWYTAPTIIKTFLESYDFSGKRVVLFATSGGSGLGKTRDDLIGCVSKDAEIVAGKVLNGSADLKSWSEQFTGGRK